MTVYIKIYSVSQKTRHQTLVHIFIILLVFASAVIVTITDIVYISLPTW